MSLQPAAGGAWFWACDILNTYWRTPVVTGEGRGIDVPDAFTA